MLDIVALRGSLVQYYRDWVTKVFDANMVQACISYNTFRVWPLWNYSILFLLPSASQKEKQRLCQAYRACNIWWVLISPLEEFHIFIPLVHSTNFLVLGAKLAKKWLHFFTCRQCCIWLISSGLSLSGFSIYTRDLLNNGLQYHRTLKTIAEALRQALLCIAECGFQSRDRWQAGLGRLDGRQSQLLTIWAFSFSIVGELDCLCH